MKKLEIVLALITLGGLIMVLMAAPAGEAIFGLANGSLAVFYFLFGSLVIADLDMDFREFLKYRGNLIHVPGIGISKFDYIIIRIVAIGISVLTIGIQFKIMDYEGFGIMLNLGLASLLIGALLSVLSYFREKKSYHPGLFVRIILFGIMGLIIYFLSTSTPVVI